MRILTSPVKSGSSLSKSNSGRREANNSIMLAMSFDTNKIRKSSGEDGLKGPRTVVVLHISRIHDRSKMTFLLVACRAPKYLVWVRFTSSEEVPSQMTRNTSST